MKDIDWKILVVLGESKNITHTADVLFMAQPNVTKRIKSIEEELGVQILVRGNKGVEFTAQGEYLLMQAKKINTLIEETKYQVSNITNTHTRVLHIAGHNNFIRTSGADLMNKICEVDDLATIQIVKCLNDEIPGLVVRGDVDIGFYSGKCRSSEGCCVEYSSSKLYVISKMAVELQDLPKLTRIEYTLPMSSQQIISDWWDKSFHEQPRNVMRVGPKDICRALVEKGVGYGLVFEDDSFDEKDGVVWTPVVMPDGTPVERKTWMAYSRRIYQQSSGRKVIDALIEKTKH